MNLVILREDDAAPGGGYMLTDHRARHILTVLKPAVGDPIAVGILGGPQGTGRVTGIKSDAVTLTCEELTHAPAPVPTVDLICALPRPQTLKKVLITAATMAVRRLHLIRANRVEKSYFHTPLLQPENCMPYLLEGLSQGRHTRLPEVRIHARFRPFFEDMFPSIEETEPPAAIKLLPDPESDESLDGSYDGSAERVVIAIGPEGGWVPFEIEQMERTGFHRYRLGRWTLRVETAVAAALAQIELVRMYHRAKGGQSPPYS